MARYTGPKSKIARRFGEPIFGADKVLSKKNYAPGQHGNNRRRKSSEYGIMLAEKQKAKYTYGVLEKQFRNTFKKADSAPGITGEVLLQNLESRLDNVVYRLGIAPTRAAARQLVYTAETWFSPHLYNGNHTSISHSYQFTISFEVTIPIGCCAFLFSIDKIFFYAKVRIKAIRECIT